MTPWSLDEIAHLRKCKFFRYPMRELILQFERHTRDEIVEALDALVRHRWDSDARNHVNEVLDMQEARIPLINGKPASDVLKHWRHVHQSPMF